MSRRRSRPTRGELDFNNGGEVLAMTRAKLIAADVENGSAPIPISEEWRVALKAIGTKARVIGFATILRGAIEADRELQPFELDTLARLLALPIQDHGGRCGKVAESDRLPVIGRLNEIVAILEGAPEPKRPEKSRPASLATEPLTREYEFDVEHNKKLGELGWGNVPPDGSVLAATVQRWFPEKETAKQISATKKAIQRRRRSVR